MTAAYDAGAANYPSADFSYVSVSGLPWGGSEDSLFAGASPAVANGDTAVVPKFVNGLALTLSSTGVPVVNAGGSLQQLAILLDVYDVSLDVWMGPKLQYINNSAPVISVVPPYASTHTIDQPIEVLDLGDYVTDPDDDALTAIGTGTLPPGLELQGLIVSGTPTSLGTYHVTFTVSDPAGAPLVLSSWTFTITDAPPLVTGNSQSAVRNLRRGRR